MPIINQPQVAILSTDGVKRRPVVVALPDGSEAIAIDYPTLCDELQPGHRLFMDDGTLQLVVESAAFSDCER